MIIEGEAISYTYPADESVRAAAGRQARAALDKVDIAVEAGEYIVILGPNGSGKSTLAKHFNALLKLQSGSLKVAGIDVRDEAEVWRLRRSCGMVFQNPDNQFVSTIVSEDIAFGLENYRVPREAIPDRVAEALERVGMAGYENRSPQQLSGGQKQRVALAGVLVLEPDILILDEVTSMLDPDGRREVLDTVRDLHEAGKTIVMITHYEEEAVNADRVLLMNRGRILADGSPRDILCDGPLMREAGLRPPFAVRIHEDLKARRVQLPFCPLTNEELVLAVRQAGGQHVL